MADKIRITADRVIARNKGVKYYADDGSIKTARKNEIEVYETQEELDAAVQAAVDSPEEVVEQAGANGAADAHEGAPDSTNDEQQASDAPAAASGSSKPKRGKGKVKEQMATKKKAAKKAAKKGNGALVRMVAGREHDISGYVKSKSASGHTSYDNGDNVAEKLRGKTLDEVYSFAAKTLKEDEKALRKQYSKLNLGMQRMSLGNRVRKVLNAKAA